MIPFCTLSSSSQSESYLGNGAEMDRFNIITFAPAKLVVEQRGSDLLQRDGFFTFFSSCWTFFGKQCWPGWLSCRQNRTPTSVFWVACVFPIFRKPRNDGLYLQYRTGSTTDFNQLGSARCQVRKWDERSEISNSNSSAIIVNRGAAVIKPVVQEGDLGGGEVPNTAIL